MASGPPPSPPTSLSPTSIRLEQVALDGEAIYWSETQPQNQGRTFVYRVGADGEGERLTPEDANAFSVRTRAHEYGGGAFAVSDGVIYFSNNSDQRLYRQEAGRPPSPITPVSAGGGADALRYADEIIDRRRGRMVCVREDHSGAGEAITALVAVDLSGSARGSGARLRKRLLFDAASQPRRKPPVLAHVAPPRHALGGDRGVGRRHS